MISRGDTLNGEVTKIVGDRGFAFLQVVDSRGNAHDIFWYVGDEVRRLRSGDRVDFVVGERVDKRLGIPRASVERIVGQ